MRIAILGSACLLVACGAHVRYEQAGKRAAVVGAVDVDAGVPARAGVRHDVTVRVWTPRAERVQWTLACADQTMTGTLGETLEAYRARRIGELRRERQRQRDAAASVGAAVGAAVLGRAEAHARAGDAEASAHVDGAAVGAMAGAATVSDDVQLAP